MRPESVLQSSGETSVRLRAVGLLVIALTLALSGCYLEKISHSANQAAVDAHEFLRAMYVEEDYDKALQIAAEPVRQSATADTMKQMVEKTRQERGDFKFFKADSYLITQGRSMEVFFVAEHANGLVYHRLVMVGDASSGYKVTGVWFKLEPYPPNPLRIKFEGEVVGFLLFPRFTLRHL
jgi:hypothetical protein